MTTGLPLPPVNRPSARGLMGAWKGVITAIDVHTGAISVSVPRLTGSDRSIPNCESALFSPPLAVGDRVFVVPLEGNRDLPVIMQRRA